MFWHSVAFLVWFFFISLMFEPINRWCNEGMEAAKSAADALCMGTLGIVFIGYFSVQACKFFGFICMIGCDDWLSIAKRGGVLVCAMPFAFGAVLIQERWPHFFRRYPPHEEDSADAQWAAIALAQQIEDGWW